jgi:hypothetical protein
MGLARQKRRPPGGAGQTPTHEWIDDLQDRQIIAQMQARHEVAGEGEDGCQSETRSFVACLAHGTESASGVLFLWGGMHSPSPSIHIRLRACFKSMSYRPRTSSTNHRSDRVA